MENGSNWKSEIWSETPGVKSNAQNQVFFSNDENESDIFAKKMFP